MSGKYDNAFKQKVLLKGIDKKVASVKRQTYKEIKRIYISDNNGEILTEMFSSAWDIQVKPYANGFNMIDCAIRLNESKYRRAKRLKDRITNMVLYEQPVFITLTFNDSTLAKTTAEKRRRLVQRYLKENCLKYVANIDYGSKKGREHYHALVSNDIVFDNWYKYGAINGERVRSNVDSPARISKYITKLTNHALKVEGLQPRIIYSRAEKTRKDYAKPLDKQEQERLQLLCS